MIIFWCFLDFRLSKGCHNVCPISFNNKIFVTLKKSSNIPLSPSSWRFISFYRFDCTSSAKKPPKTCRKAPVKFKFSYNSARNQLCARLKLYVCLCRFLAVAPLVRPSVSQAIYFNGRPWQIPVALTGD
jgi:hypothetical protein